MATEQGTHGPQLSGIVKVSVRKVALDVYRRLFDSVLRVTLANSLGCCEEEEDGEIEAISAVNMEGKRGTIIVQRLFISIY